MVVVGTRPELIRLSRILAELDKTFDLILVHTGQNYDRDLNQIFFEDLGLPAVDYYLDAAGTSSVDTIGKVIQRVDPIIAKSAPDAMLVLGDTDSCYSLIAGRRNGIPTFHMEAGNRCFDSNVPEEINRRIVDHTADINLPYSEISRQMLIRENIAPDKIITTGSPMAEVCLYYRHKIDSSRIVDKLQLESFFVLSSHRAENVDSYPRLSCIFQSIDAVIERYNLDCVFSCHPRTQKKISEFDLQLNPRIKIVHPLSFTDYCKLQIESEFVISDSGTVSEEAVILGFTAFNMRETHERHEAMEEASVIMTGLSKSRLIEAIDVTRDQEFEQGDRQIPRDYTGQAVSKKIVRILLSYVDYANKSKTHIG